MGPDEVSKNFSQFVALIASVSAVPFDEGQVTLQTHLADDLAMDSISLVALMALAQEAFGLSLTDRPEAVADIQTVGDALGLIDAMLAAD